MTAPSAEVMYLWDGTKVRTSSALGQGRLYKGSFVYSVSPTGTQLESISHDEGRILAAAGAKQKKLYIGPDDMQTKVLELIIPKGASQKQIEQLQLLREYAQQYEIQFTIIIAK